jgi:hypothetical protein
VAAANKIRLMYFWADESVMAEDFRRKTSKKMSEFARDFFGRYGFEIDVKPGYEPGKVLDSRRFALVKNDGVQPNVEVLVEIRQRYAKLLRELLQEQAEAIRIQAERQKAADAAIERVNAAEAANDTPALTAANKAAELANIRHADALRKREDVARRIEEAISQPDDELARADFERQFRQQLGVKWILGVLEPKRLPVVFCRYVTHFLSMRGSTFSVTGITFQAEDTPFQFFGGDWLWPAAFVPLSIEGAEPKNLAHEIVHAAGHPAEPPDVETIKDLKKYLSFKPEPMTGSLGERAKTLFKNYVEYRSLFEVAPGGDYAGESANDIMNYKAHASDSSASNLADADKKLLEAAFFVVP